MALRKVQSGVIADNAITSAKIASGAITASDIAAGAAVPSQTGNAGKYLKTDGNSSSWEIVPVPTPTAISDQDNTSTGYLDLPSGTTGQRPGSPTQGMIRYNTTLGLAEQYNSSGWQGIDAPPVVLNSSGIINENTDSTITVTGSNFKPGAVIYIEAAAVSNVSRALVTTYVSSTQLTAATNAAAQNFVGGATYDIKVVNPSGLDARLTNAASIDRDPIWSTSAGSLVSPYAGQTSSASVIASDPDGNTVSYSVVSGSLPSGISLNTSTGALTGTYPTVASLTTYPFTIRATANNQTIDRSFSIGVKPSNTFSDLVTNYYWSTGFQNNSGPLPISLWDDECSGGGLIHGADGENSESQNWFVLVLGTSVKLNTAQIKARSHPQAYNYLANWKVFGGNGSQTSYNDSGWSLLFNPTGYSPNPCTLGSQISNPYSSTGYTRYLFTFYGNQRGGYNSFSQLILTFSL